MTDNICYSGGAIGADRAFGKAAAAAGHRVVHFSFDGHNIAVPEGTAIILTEDQLLAADPFLQQAMINAKKGRLSKKSDFVKKLLRRNYWQVRNADSVYAVSSLKDEKVVAGGTGYAVQMFIDRGLISTANRCYVFDQEQKKWFVWNRSWAQFKECSKLPKPEGRYAGIGSRKLNRDGFNAIMELYDDN